MNLKNLKFQPLDHCTQIIVFDEGGNVIDSDETLIKLKGKSFNLYEDTMFCGMEETLADLAWGEQIHFDCINTNLFGKESFYDFIITALEEGKRSLIVYDFGKQYDKIFELQQERNIAEIQNKKLERKIEELTKEKETGEKLYEQLKNGDQDEFVMIKSESILYNVNMDSIYYLEAFGDYIKIYSEEKTYVTHNTMKKVQEILPSNRFIRTHRSFLVQLNKIENVEQMSLQINGKILPIGRNYKSELAEKINQI